MRHAMQFCITVTLLLTFSIGSGTPEETVTLREREEIHPAVSAEAAKNTPLSPAAAATAIPPTTMPTAAPSSVPTGMPKPSPTPFVLLQTQHIPAGDAWEAYGLVSPNGQRFLLSPYAKAIGVSEADIELAARVAYFEAGPRASEAAHRAVLCVIYNRCMATRFGGEVTDIKTEVYRKNQFSVIGHRRFLTAEMPESLLRCARDIFLWGRLSLPENVLFFHAASLGSDWGGRKVYGNIGGNLFFYGRTE